MSGAQTLENVLHLAPLRFARARSALGRLLYWHYRLFRARRRRDWMLERFGSAPLLVSPQVLHPRLMRSGVFFADAIPAFVPAGAEVLDMGTGSGICALAAAARARCVTAVDINPAAAHCARINVLLNRLDDRVQVLQGDLFAPVHGERFDVVLFNPPFKAGAPRDEADRAWRAGDVAERFAAGLRAHLAPAGFALVVLSTYGEGGAYLRQFQRQNLAVELLTQRRFVNERLSLLRVRPVPHRAAGS